MKKIIAFSLFFCWFHIINAQTKSAFIKAGDRAYKTGDYFTAMSHYGEALEFPGNQTKTHYNYAEAARQFFAYEEAVDAYKYVLGANDARKFPLAPYWLGKTYQSLGEYEKAITVFNNFIQSSGNQLFNGRAKADVTDCEWALSLINTPHNQEVIHLEKSVNSPYSEFGPLLKNDTLFFSSYKFRSTKKDENPTQKISKMLIQKGTAKGRPLPRKINKSDQLTAHTTFDGNRMYFTICAYETASDIRCEIYYTERDKRKRWVTPKKLPDHINLKGYTATHPNIGENPNTGKTALYFVSNRPDGAGGLDIYYSDVKGNDFGEPQNLSELNTVEDDITPFYDVNRDQLYFSSKGYRGLGGFDIYQSSFDGNIWTAPKHTGYPLNSSYNDVYFVLNADSTEAYISSNRLGSFYLEEKNKACCNDIYKVNILPPPPPAPEPPVVQVDTVPTIPVSPEPPVSPPVVEVPPAVEPEPPVEPVPVVPEVKNPPVVEAPSVEPTPEVPVTPPTLRSYLPLPLYFHNDEPDRRSWLSTTNKNYSATYQSYFPLKQEYMAAVPSDLRLETDRFFEEEVKGGYNRLELFAADLIKRLEIGEKYEILLSGYTSPRAATDYNQALGQRRVVSVLNYFKTYQQRVFLSYIQSGQLKFTQKSLGETTSPLNISDQLSDRQNSVYHPAAARERRVEILEIRLKN